MKEKRKKSFSDFGILAKQFALLTIAVIDFITAYKSFKGGDDNDEQE